MPDDPRGQVLGILGTLGLYCALGLALLVAAGWLLWVVAMGVGR